MYIEGLLLYRLLLSSKLLEFAGNDEAATLWLSLLSGYLFARNFRASLNITALSAEELSERAVIAAERSLSIELTESRAENSSLYTML